MSPPGHALVLAVDEKSQIRALDRTAPCLAAGPSSRRREDPVERNRFVQLDGGTRTVTASSRRRRGPWPG